MNKIAKIKSGRVPHYLTEEKEYKVVSDNGRGFTIQNDEGYYSYCNRVNCSHLGGGEWEVIER